MTRPMLLTTYSARGKGPHEFLRPQVFEALNDNNIQLYDIRTGKLYEMNIDHLADCNLELLDTLLIEFEARNAYNIKRLARERQIAYNTG